MIKRSVFRGLIVFTLISFMLFLLGCGGSGSGSDSGGVDEPGGEDTVDINVNIPIFPADNPWNTDISNYPVHPNSDNFVESIGLNVNLHPDFGTVWQGAPNGIPFIVVEGDQTKVPVTFTIANESDPGPYPIPNNAPIQGGPNATGDRHVIVIDRDNHILYELFDAHKENNGWRAYSGAKWNLNSNELRPIYWTSADAAGLPIFPGLVRYDEVVSGEIKHALRFTVRYVQKGFISPARHYVNHDGGSPNPSNLPPMGLRFRLKADYDISGFSPKNQVILRALKKYGMFVSDVGANWFVCGAPDPRWDDSDLFSLQRVKGSDFEAIYTGEITGSPY